MTQPIGPKLNVKDAVNAVRAFINDLYGPDGLRYSQVEEVEYFDQDDQWLITMSFTSPANIVMNPNLKDLKTFKVDASSGVVLSMRIRGKM